MKNLLIISAFILPVVSVSGQKIGVLNSKDKVIYRLKPGKSLDFRIDYNKLYPEKKDSILEIRLYSTIDSIVGSELYLTENQVVLHYTQTRSLLIEQPLEKDRIKIGMNDIDALSVSPTMQSVGDAMLIIGIAAMVVSPLFGLTSSRFATERMVLVAGMGAGSALIGGALSLIFKEKPVQIRDFDGPPYFKKYQRGGLTVLE